MTKAEKLRKYNEAHRPSCFGREHKMRRGFCEVCKHYKDCEEEFWNRIASDGENPEPIPSREDD